MKFEIEKSKYNIHSLMKRLGYSPHPKNESFVRRLGADKFPRFHVYFKDLPDKFEIAIHLDQKGACHTGQTAHSGDYDGQNLQEEKLRIKNLLDNIL